MAKWAAKFASICCLIVFCGLVSGQSIQWDEQIGQVAIVNGRLELIVQTKSGLNPCSLRDLKSGWIYADRDYVWSGGTEFPKMLKPPAITNQENGNCSVVFRGQLGSLQVEQTFTAPKNEPGVILENITISNPADGPMDTANFKCGFAKWVREGEDWSQDANDVRFCPIPYRRETSGQMQEFPLRQVAEQGSSFCAWMEPVQPTPMWGAEGWVCSGVSSTFLIAKYNPEGMEWSLMEPLKRGTETIVCFGGAGQWKHNHPEGSTRLDPGKSYSFGQTRLQTIDGDWKQAYYAYRGYMESKGCKTPAGYNPPVHWNELYDNEYFGRVCALGGEYVGPSGPGYCPELYEKINGLLDQCYTLDLMKGEAAKAAELGCEVLYLDPGWDTGKVGGLQVWDAARLGPMNSFVEMIRKDYGLKGVSLWCSLAGVPPTYCDAAAYPSAQVLTQDGKKAEYLICHPCPGFLDEKERLLLELCKNGAVFLMFDSNQYSGPCYDTTHGHRIPSTREEHAAALFELARRVKAQYPNVLIEMHDPITGPCNIHYTPTYFGYHPPHSFDCLWGHEFMWNPMDDILSYRAVSLYYYNLAYSIPLYLHVNLKTDNPNALVLWWYASTCRHLGVGGKSGDAAVWQAQKGAMKTYLRLKPFFVQGEFYGLDEMIHVHTLREKNAAVINCFNLAEAPEVKNFTFKLSEVGLSGQMRYNVIGANSWRQEGEEIQIQADIAGRDAKVLEIIPKT